MSSSSNSEGTKTGPIVLHRIRNLVFQGGSVKGVSYGGAVGALHRAFSLKGLCFHKQIENVAGTSAGAITALGMAVGTNVEELVMTMGTTDFKSFLDTKAYEIVSNISSETASGPSQASSALATLPLLTSSMGLASGQEILDFLETFVKERTGISHLTFGELHELVLEGRKKSKPTTDKELDQGSYKDLFVMAYNLTVDNVFVFNYLTTPDSIISDSVRCSMSIPFIFVPHKNFIKKPNPEKPGEYTRVEVSDHLWIDGGITDNYPIGVFDKLANVDYADTLGFYLASSEEKAEIEGHPVAEEDKTKTHREIKNIIDYAKCVIETVISSQQTTAHKQSSDINRTIYIDHKNMSMMNFGMTLDEKNALITSGWDSVCARLRLTDEIGPCEVLLKLPVEEVEEEEEAKGQGDKCCIA